MLQRGDAPPRELGISFPDGQYLPGFPNKHQFLSAGEWGQDMDVRRVLLQSGSLCGSGIYSNHCVNMGKAVVDETWPATAIETRYIFTVQSGPGMLKNVKVAVQKDENDDVFITAIDAGYLNRPCAASSSAATCTRATAKRRNMGANYKNRGHAHAGRIRRGVRQVHAGAGDVAFASVKRDVAEALAFASVKPVHTRVSHHLCVYFHIILNITVNIILSYRPVRERVKSGTRRRRLGSSRALACISSRSRSSPQRRVRLTRDRCLPHRPPGFRFRSSRS